MKFNKFIFLSILILSTSLFAQLEEEILFEPQEFMESRPQSPADFAEEIISGEEDLIIRGTANISSPVYAVSILCDYELDLSRFGVINKTEDAFDAAGIIKFTNCRMFSSQRGTTSSIQQIV